MVLKKKYKLLVSKTTQSTSYFLAAIVNELPKNIN